ncbi:MAG: hypothetical protein HY207_13575 [Nitrospirae bacterium]|nr:hypothetical protein [Nitrospirota bacterium]
MLRINLAVCGVVVPMLMSLLSQAGAYAFEYRMQPGLALYQWKEAFDQGTPKESGPLATFGVSVSGFPSTLNPDVSLRNDFQLFLGRMSYDTFAQSLSTSSVLIPLSTHTVYLGFNYEGTVGFRSAHGPAVIEPFIGLGLRWWDRYIESANGVSGYEELYATMYSRAGIRLQHNVSEGHATYSMVSVDPMLWAREQIDWVRISGDTLTVKNGLRPGWTVEFGVRGPTVDGTVYWRATRFGESNKVACLGGTARCFQPTSTQDIIGLNVAFVF